MTEGHLDPETRFGQKRNSALLAMLSDQAVPGTGPPGTYANAEGYELHTHPDLEERLAQVARSLPSHLRAMVYGCPVLAAKNGVIFAVAWGTSALVFRLDDADVPSAVEMGGRPARETEHAGISPASALLESNWIWFDPWNSKAPSRKWLSDLEYFCERACRFALGAMR